MNESKTGVILPEDGIIDTKWAKDQLSRVDVFSQELLNYGRGEVFFMLQTNLSQKAFEDAIQDLDYTLATAYTYISYLQKRPILETIKEKLYVALSLSAAEYIPDNIEDALALLDVCIAKFGKPTADNLKKAAETTGTLPKRMSEAALSVEVAKKKALQKWLLEEHNLTEAQVIDAQRTKPEGKAEFVEKMVEAFDRLEDWNEFYSIIAKPVHDSDNMKALRFLADINDASGSIMEYLQAEKAFNNLNALKEEFTNNVYPELSFKEHGNEL
jgi:hypothetical protein